MTCIKGRSGEPKKPKNDINNSNNTLPDILGVWIADKRLNFSLYEDIMDVYREQKIGAVERDRNRTSFSMRANLQFRFSLWCSKWGSDVLCRCEMTWKMENNRWIYQEWCREWWDLDFDIISLLPRRFFLYIFGEGDVFSGPICFTWKICHFTTFGMKLVEIENFIQKDPLTLSQKIKLIRLLLGFLF